MRMYKHRRYYWSNTRLADKIRLLFGIGPKPGYATSKGWKQWKEASKKANRIGYWLSEKFLNSAQDAVFYPFDLYSHLKSKWRLRFKDRPHLINTKLEKDTYHEVPDRMLYGMFSLLEDFIEKEKATKEGDVKSAIDHLQWEMKLTYDSSMGLDHNDPILNTPTIQAWSAAEQVILYHWWKEVRPNRVNPYDVYASSRELADSDDIDDFLSADTPPEEIDRYEKIDQLEKQYREEDTEMLLRLVRIRHSLWT